MRSGCCYCRSRCSRLRVSASGPTLTPTWSAIGLSCASTRSTTTTQLRAYARCCSAPVRMPWHMLASLLTSLRTSFSFIALFLRRDLQLGDQLVVSLERCRATWSVHVPATEWPAALRQLVDLGLDRRLLIGLLLRNEAPVRVGGRGQRLLRLVAVSDAREQAHPSRPRLHLSFALGLEEVRRRPDRIELLPRLRLGQRQLAAPEAGEGLQRGRMVAETRTVQPRLEPIAELRDGAADGAHVRVEVVAPLAAHVLLGVVRGEGARQRLVVLRVHRDRGIDVHVEDSLRHVRSDAGRCGYVRELGELRLESVRDVTRGQIVRQPERIRGDCRTVFAVDLGLVRSVVVRCRRGQVLLLVLRQRVLLADGVTVGDLDLVLVLHCLDGLRL